MQEQHLYSKWNKVFFKNIRMFVFYSKHGFQPNLTLFLGNLKQYSRKNIQHLGYNYIKYLKKVKYNTIIV